MFAISWPGLGACIGLCFYNRMGLQPAHGRTSLNVLGFIVTSAGGEGGRIHFFCEGNSFTYDFGCAQFALVIRHVCHGRVQVARFPLNGFLNCFVFGNRSCHGAPLLSFVVGKPMAAQHLCQQCWC